MGKPCSLDLRERIVGYVVAGHSARAAGWVFGVSASTAVRLVDAQRRQGTLAARPQGRAPGTAGKLAAHRAFLIEIVRAKPDITARGSWLGPCSRRKGCKRMSRPCTVP